MTPPSRPSGPELLEERSLGGILVHILGLVTGFVGPALLYVVSEHEHTRANARHALNWHISVFVLFVVSLVLFLLGADTLTIGAETTELVLLPEPVATVVGVVGFALLMVLALASFLTIVYAFIATVKAIFGSVWTYPGSVSVVERYF